MSKLSQAQIDEIRERVEFAAKEAEEAAFTLAAWTADWRRRHAMQQPPSTKESVKA